MCIRDRSKDNKTKPENPLKELPKTGMKIITCLLYTSDAADDTPCVDLGGRRIIKKLTLPTILRV
ncbi:hypothetical protein JMUB7528_28600 [Staphylococcus aureus]